MGVFWDIIKISNLNYGHRKRRISQQRHKYKIIKEMSRNLEKDTPILAQEAYRIPNKLDPKRDSVPYNIS